MDGYFERFKPVLMPVPYLIVKGGQVIEVVLLTTGDEAIAYANEHHPGCYCAVVVGGQENGPERPDAERRIAS